MPRVETVLRTAESLIHDVVLLLSGEETEALSNVSERERLFSWSNALGYPGASNLLGAIAQARDDLGANVNGRLVIDTLLSRWARELGAARKGGSQRG